MITKLETAAKATPPMANDPKIENGTVSASGQTAAAPHLKQVVDLDTAIEGTKAAEMPTLSNTYTDAAASGASSPTGTPPQPMNGHTFNVGGLMNGKLVTQLVDAVLPSLAVALLYRIGIKVKKTELQLTAKEVDILAPIVQDCLNTVNANMSSPWQSLSVALLVIYGSKIAEKSAMQWIEKLDAPKKEEAMPEPVKTPEKILDGMKEAAMTFTEDEIKAEMKRAKVGRDRAVLLLKRKQEKK